MTEAEWLACRNPFAMIWFVMGQPGMVRRKTGRRRLRLASVACSRLLAELFPEPVCLMTIDVAERLADDEATVEELGETRGEAMKFCARQFGQVGPEEQPREGIGPYQVARACSRLLDSNVTKFALSGVLMAYDSDPRADAALCSRQAVLVRCIFGGLFSKGSLPAGWNKWHDGTLPRIAQAIYANRNFDCLPLLADALEDTGCTDCALLDHCRQPGEHARGCWVIDLLLGKG